MRNLVLVILLFLVNSSFTRSRHLIEIDVLPEDRVVVEQEFVRMEYLCDSLSRLMFYYDYGQPPYLRPEDQMPKVLLSIYAFPSVRYQHYLSVYNEIEKAYAHAWNTLSYQHFSRSFDQLDAHQQRTIKSILPRKVSEAEPGK